VPVELSACVDVVVLHCQRSGSGARSSPHGRARGRRGQRATDTCGAVAGVAETLTANGATAPRSGPDSVARAARVNSHPTWQKARACREQRTGACRAVQAAHRHRTCARRACGRLVRHPASDWRPQPCRARGGRQPGQRPPASPSLPQPLARPRADPTAMMPVWCSSVMECLAVGPASNRSSGVRGSPAPGGKDVVKLRGAGAYSG